MRSPRFGPDPRQQRKDPLARAAFALNSARHFSLNTDADAELPASTRWAAAFVFEGFSLRLQRLAFAVEHDAAAWMHCRQLPALSESCLDAPIL